MRDKNSEIEDRGTENRGTLETCALALSVEGLELFSTLSFFADSEAGIRKHI